MVFRGGLETERGDEGNISKLVEWSVCTRNAGSNLNKRTTTSHLSAVCDAERRREGGREKGRRGGRRGDPRARNTGHGHFFSTCRPLSFPLRFVVSYRPVPSVLGNSIVMSSATSKGSCTSPLPGGIRGWTLEGGLEEAWNFFYYK